MNMFENKPRPVTENTSKEIAKQRLKSILMRDRVDVSKELIEQLREDVLGVAADYFTVSENKSEIYLANMKRSENEDNETMLVCMIPVARIKNN